QRLDRTPSPGSPLGVYPRTRFRKRKQKNQLHSLKTKTVKKMIVIFPVMLTRGAFLMAKQRAKASTPNTVNFTVARRYLTEREVERLIEAAKRNRHGPRDATMRSSG